MENKKPTSGEILAYGVLPFMTSKHTESKENCIKMISKPVDNHLSKKDLAINAAIEYIETGKTTLQGLTFSTGINPNSFVNQLKLFLEDATTNTK